MIDSFPAHTRYDRIPQHQLGGDNVQHKNIPDSHYMVYIVYRSFKCPPPIKKQ